MKTTTENLEKIFDHSATIEDFYFELYFMWCESVSTNLIEFQQILACKSVSKWFAMEYSKLIKEYEKSIEKYPSATANESFTLYVSWIFKVFSIRPKSLLEAAKKRDESRIKLAGVRVLTNLFSSN
jgi:hypothetical protein